MPAVTRGAAPARNPGAQTSRRRSAAAQPIASPLGSAIDPGLALGVAAAVAAAMLLLIVSTGGRAKALVAGAADATARSFASAGFKLTSLRLRGVSPAAQDDVLRAAQLTRGQPLMSIDLAALRERVERVGWIQSARVARLFPDTLVLSVVERPRLAVWQMDGQTHLVDARGQIIPEADPARFADLPLVVGEGANEDAAAILPLVQARPGLMSRLDALVRVDARRWDLRLKDGGIIQLPAKGEEAALIQLDQLVQRSRILELGFARIDLRDPDFVTVRPRAAGELPVNRALS